MARVRSGAITKARHKKILKQAKGFFGSRHRLYKTAKESVMHQGKYAFRDRRQNKRNFRKLWITRINAATREYDLSYSKFINGLNKAGIIINRKMLAEIAIDDKEEFKKLVDVAKDALNGKMPKVESKPAKKETSTKEVKTTAKKEVKTEKKETKTTKKTTEKKETKTDLSKKTVAELKEMAKKKKIEGYTSMKKAELLEALK